jgi:hypothetical protein
MGRIRKPRTGNSYERKRIRVRRRFYRPGLKIMKVTLLSGFCNLDLGNRRGCRQFSEHTGNYHTT